MKKKVVKCFVVCKYIYILALYLKTNKMKYSNFIKQILKLKVKVSKYEMQAAYCIYNAFNVSIKESLELAKGK